MNEKEKLKAAIKHINTIVGIGYDYRDRTDYPERQYSITTTRHHSLTLDSWVRLFGAVVNQIDKSGEDSLGFIENQIVLVAEAMTKDIAQYSDETYS
jgi:hypothetical protein